MTIPTMWLPSGITVCADLCWHLVPADGAPFPAWFDLGDLSHHGTQDEAVAEATRIGQRLKRRGKPPLPLVPELLAAPCWIAKAACGHSFDAAGFAVQHFETAEDAFGGALDGTRWSVQADRLVCPRGPECAGIGVV